MPDENEVGGRLRIGRWLPSLQPARRHVTLDQPVGPSAGERTVADPEPAIETSDGGSGVRSRRQTVLIGAIVPLVLLLPVSVIGTQWTGSAPDTTGPLARDGHRITDRHLPPDSTSGTVTPSASAPVSSGAETSRPGSAGLPAAGTGTGLPTGSVTHPPVTPGRIVELDAVSAPGYRVRHRDFVGRIDRIGPYSSRPDRADSSFTVRAGLADPRCVSFESVNYPGLFLRHQNFAIRLHRAERTALFAADATFCAVTGLTGQHTSFRSLNYPDRYLVHRDHLLRIEPVGPSDATRAAMTFAVSAAL